MYQITITSELLAVISLVLARLHFIYIEDLLLKLAEDLAEGYDWRLRLFQVYFDLSNIRLNFHISILLGMISIAWAGHWPLVVLFS